MEFLGKLCREVVAVKIWKNSALFCLGGTAYVALEMLWRGRSHSSMFLAGGGCFLLLGDLRRRLGAKSLPLRGAAGSGVITAVELLTGLLVNRDHRVWDYRDLPLNFRGQICLPYSLLWVPLSIAAMEIYAAADRKLMVR